MTAVGLVMVAGGILIAYAGLTGVSVGDTLREIMAGGRPAAGRPATATPARDSTVRSA